MFTVSFGNALAQDSYVGGYYRNDGTYVQPHYRSAPNNTPYDNWSSQGNVNPYTNSVGSQRPRSLNNGSNENSFQPLTQPRRQNNNGYRAPKYGTPLGR